MTWYWWDDAIGWAHYIARETQIRHKVTRTAGGWTVELAEDAVANLEVCS